MRLSNLSVGCVVVEFDQHLAGHGPRSPGRFVIPHGIPVPRGCNLRRMGLVHAHVTEFVIPEVKESDLVRLLQYLHAELKKKCRGPPMANNDCLESDERSR
jgi:hypothetical protein